MGGGSTLSPELLNEVEPAEALELDRPAPPSRALVGSGGVAARANAVLTAALRAIGTGLFRLRLHRLVIWLGRARPKVLCYHAVEPEETDFTRGLGSSVTPRTLRRHLEFISRHYRVVPLTDVEQGKAGPGSVAITFDDGYRSVADHAMPLLAARGWPSTHFLIADAIGNERLVWTNELAWFLANHPETTTRLLAERFGVDPAGRSPARAIAAVCDRYDPVSVAALLESLRAATGVDPARLAREARLYIDWGDVDTMRAQGATFGNHTATHPSLPRLPEEEQRSEIARARATIEEQIGRITGSLAVPFGHVDHTTRRAAAAAGHAAIAEVGGVNDRRNPARIARVLVTARDEAELFAEMEVVTPVRAWIKRALERRSTRGLAPNPPRAAHRPLRVLFVWFSDYPWDVRVEKVCSTLTAAGYDVHLAARNRDRRPLRSVLSEGTVHRIAPWRWLGRGLDAALQFPVFLNPRWTRLLARIAREAPPDVIIARDLPLCPAAIRLGRRLGVPVILDMAENYAAFMRAMRDAGHHGLLGRLLRSPRILEAVERYSVRRVDRVLTVVDESAERVARLIGRPDRVAVVSNTPRRELAERAARSATGDPNGDNSRRRLEVAYLGMLEIPRGIDELVDAAAALRNSSTPVRVTLVGDGPDAPAFRARARAAGLTDDDVVFMGQLPLASALDIVARADVGVVPLRRCEAYDTTVPNKLFDYMALGLPVVTSDTVPCARIVRETGAGEVYRAGDPRDLTRALLRLTDPAVRSAAGEAGRRAVLTRYNWERDAEVLRRTVDAVARPVAANRGTA